MKQYTSYINLHVDNCFLKVNCSMSYIGYRRVKGYKALTVETMGISKFRV